MSPFIAGYATAILERDFFMPGVRVRVQDGVIQLDSEEVHEKDRPKIVAALLRIRGARDVVIAPREDGGRPSPLRPDPLPLTGGGWKLFASFWSLGKEWCDARGASFRGQHRLSAGLNRGPVLGSAGVASILDALPVRLRPDTPLPSAGRFGGDVFPPSGFPLNSKDARSFEFE